MQQQQRDPHSDEEEEEEVVFEDHAPIFTSKVDDVDCITSKRSSDKAAPSECLDSKYGDPACAKDIAEIYPRGSGGLVWHVQLVSDDWIGNEKDCTPEGEIRARRPTLPVREKDFFKSLVRTQDGRWMFSGVLNGWPALTCLEVRSITCKVKGRVYGTRIKRVWDAARSSEPPFYPRAVKSVRATLVSPPWSARGWSKSSPGCVWWFFSQREEKRGGAVLRYGEDMIRFVRNERVVNERGSTNDAEPRATRAHLFAHRYARGKKRETKKDKVTYHAAVLIEWDHKRHCTLIELATLNGVGGRYGR